MPVSGYLTGSGRLKIVKHPQTTETISQHMSHTVPTVLTTNLFLPQTVAKSLCHMTNLGALKLILEKTELNC